MHKIYITMFISSSSNCKNPMFITNRRTDNTKTIHALDYYSAIKRMSMVVHTCNLRHSKGKAGGSQVQGQPRQN
jgi:hypothetical protein